MDGGPTIVDYRRMAPLHRFQPLRCPWVTGQIDPTGSLPPRRPDGERLHSAAFRPLRCP